MANTYKTANPTVVVNFDDIQLTINGVKQVDAEGKPVLDEEEWLKIRRDGIGGSDSATVLGISPWKTKQELMDDKRGVSPLVAKQFNTLSKEIGHMAESYIRYQIMGYIFKKMGKNVIVQEDRRMYQHGNPAYAFARADLDGLLFVDGEICIAEIKTTSPRNVKVIEEWKSGIIPRYYESQLRHYMAVMNVNKAWICCCWGLNPEEDAVLLCCERNMALEEQLLNAEREFWETHVVNGLPILPEEECDKGALILDYYGRRSVRNSNKTAIDASMLAPLVASRAALVDQLDELKSQSDAIKSEIEDIDANIVLQLGNEEYGCYQPEPSKRIDIYVKSKMSNAAYDLEEVKQNCPEIYNKAIKTTFVLSSLTNTEKTAIKPYLLPKTPTGKVSISIKEVELDENGKRRKK